jgi:hypothetical protein
MVPSNPVIHNVPIDCDCHKQMPKQEPNTMEIENEFEFDNFLQKIKENEKMRAK